MTTQEPSNDTRPNSNPVLGCGCLVLILLIVAGLAGSCLAGSSEQPPPVAAPATTTSTPPPTTWSTPPPASYAPPAYVPPAPAPSVPDRDCVDFGSQAEAQAALQPGDPEQLDPDNDGQACENYFARQNRQDTYVPVPDPPADDDSGTRPRSGNSGHPCRPGERDGDNDGYCGEG